jgi:hypothetical protein
MVSKRKNYNYSKLGIKTKILKLHIPTPLIRSILIISSRLQFLLDGFMTANGISFGSVTDKVQTFSQLQPKLAWFGTNGQSGASMTLQQHLSDPY